MSKNEQNTEREQNIQNGQNIEEIERNQRRTESEQAEADGTDAVEQAQEPEKNDALIRHGDEEIVINLKSVKEKVSRCKEKVSQNKEKTQQKSGTAIASWKKKIAAKRKRLIALAVIIVVGTLAVRYVVEHTGYRGMMNEIVGIINDREGDMDVIALAVLPGDIAECYEEAVGIIGQNTYVEDALESLETNVDSQYAKLDDFYGSNAKISVKVLEKEKMSQSQIRRAQSSYQEYYEEYLEEIVSGINEFDHDRISGLAEQYHLLNSDVLALKDDINVVADYLEDMDITKGYNLTVQINIRGSKDHYEEEIDLRVIKVNGEWMIDYLSVSAAKRVMQRFGSGMDNLLWFL